ncbi:MAG: hypothetical protein JSV05_07125 [Candidatus Bathyarchaeota archaeon]|nr:MAG: hypothetical protein JSV05_07125 [Candidatus Bathyarchaeota archaeon]
MRPKQVFMLIIGAVQSAVSILGAILIGLLLLDPFALQIRFILDSLFLPILCSLIIFCFFSAISGLFLIHGAIDVL